jgi:hypothetical protein
MREDGGWFYRGVWLRVKTAKSSSKRANSYVILNVSTTMRPFLGKVVILDFYLLTGICLGFVRSQFLNVEQGTLNLEYTPGSENKSSLHYVKLTVYVKLINLIISGSPWPITLHTPSFSRQASSDEE